MKSLLLGVVVAIVFIAVAEWFFMHLEIRPSQYLSISHYLAESPDDTEFQAIVTSAIADGAIRSKEHKTIVDHVLRRDGIYRIKTDVPESLEEARQVVRKTLSAQALTI